MNRSRYRDFMMIDPSMDRPIFPTVMHQGINVLGPGAFDPYDFDDGYADFSEIEYEPYKEHKLR